MNTLDEDQFKLIERAAVTGARCPMSHPFGPLKGGPVQRLLIDGRIRIEIFAGNWRVVTILQGPNAGATTRRSPKGGQPYRTLEGVRRKA
jgi:hypothetical protein